MVFNILKCQKGLTLVELLAAIVISGIVITAAYTLLFTNQSAYFVTVARDDAYTSARIAQDNVITNIRRADQRELFSTVSGNTLVLKIPDINGFLEDFNYTVEKNNATNMYELILTKGTARFVVATNIDGADGFYVTYSEEEQLLNVKVKTVSRRYNQTATFEMENHHKIKVET